MRKTKKAIIMYNVSFSALPFMGSNSFSTMSWKNSFCSPPSSTPSSPSNSTLSCFRRSIGFMSEIASSCVEGEKERKVHAKVQTPIEAIALL